MKKYILLTIVVCLLFGCEDKHRKMQEEIQTRKERLQHHQDSALQASQQEVQRLDEELQRVNRQYEQMKRQAEQAHAAGTATYEQLSNVTKMRMHRDSLQTQFDVLCAKIKYIHKRPKE